MIEVKKSRGIKEIKIPERPRPAVTHLPDVSKLPTAEEMKYRKMVSKNAHLESLVNTLGLVSASTGQPIQLIESGWEQQPSAAAAKGSQNSANPIVKVDTRIEVANTPSVTLEKAKENQKGGQGGILLCQNSDKAIESNTPAPVKGLQNSAKLLVNEDKIHTLAKKIIKGEQHYTPEAIVQLIEDDSKVSRDRAQKGFEMMIAAGAIEPTPAGTYYLAGSTPF